MSPVCHAPLSAMQAARGGSLQEPLLQLLGLRWEGLGAALSLPVLLTAVLFLGPLTTWAWERYHDASSTRRSRPALQVTHG